VFKILKTLGRKDLAMFLVSLVAPTLLPNPYLMEADRRKGRVDQDLVKKINMSLMLPNLPRRKKSVDQDPNLDQRRRTHSKLKNLKLLLILANKSTRPNLKNIYPISKKEWIKIKEKHS
jgi:hypothetical protein